MKFKLKPLVFSLLADNRLYANSLESCVYIKPVIREDGISFHYYQGNGKLHEAKTLEDAKDGCRKIVEDVIRKHGIFEVVEEDND